MSNDLGKSGITVSVSVLAQLMRYIDHLKIDRVPLFKAAGLDPAILETPDFRLPIEQYIALEDEAARVAADPCFGLHMGEFFETGNWSILGYMMMNCRTLGEAFEKSGRYADIIGNLIRGKAQFRFHRVRMILTTPKHAPALSRHCFECVFSSAIRMSRILSGRPIRPLEVGFSYPPPHSDTEYRRIFECPVHFGCKYTYMDMDLSIGRIPVLLPNPSLLEHFEQYAREYLSGIEGIDKTTREVTRLILANLDNQALSIRSIAKKMSLSVRTLQNRLKTEGTVFSELLEQTRQRLAKKYLRENYTVEDITYLLGFSEASVFRKAFKKWSGQTPGEFRKTALTNLSAK